MDIENRLKKLLEESGRERQKDERFTSLRDFYQKMKDEGYVAEPTYTLPPADMVGRGLYPSQNNSRRVQ